MSRSAAIRNYLAKNKGAKPKDVVQALAQDGIQVSAALVSFVKGDLKKKKGKKAKRTLHAKTVAFNDGVLVEVGKVSKKRRKKKSATLKVASLGLSAGDLSAKDQIGILVKLKKAIKPITNKLTAEQTKQSLDILRELVFDK